MKKHFSIDQLATASLRQAQSQAAMTRRDINKLRDSIAGLTRSIHAPVIHPKRLKTKKTTQTSPLGGVGGILFSELINTGILGDGIKASGTVKLGGLSLTDSASTNSSAGGYGSAAQAAANLGGLLTLIQRNR